MFRAIFTTDSISRARLPFTLVAMTCFASAAAGCAGPDITMKNPISAGAGQLPENRIVKTQDTAEAQRGLPVGSMADEATIDAADGNQVCVKVALHAFSAIDLARAETKFKTNTGTLEKARITLGESNSKTYQGLVPHDVQTGAKEECRYDNGKSVCEVKPIIQTTMVPGQVEVFKTTGRVCAPNQNLVTDATTQMLFNVEIPTATAGAWGFGHGSKDVTFRWAFQH